MKHAHAVLLVALAVAAMPAAGAEVDHSRMEHSQSNHASGDEATKEAPSGHAAGDDAIHSYMLFNQLEGRDSDSGAGFGWDLKGWIGTDLTRLWLRSEGKIVSGRAEAVDLEILYGRSVSTWWDLVAGLRSDFSQGESRMSGALGIQGLAPQRIELSATIYLGGATQGALRVEAEHELLLTNRLVLQPHIELNAHGNTDAARGIGSGLSSLGVGLRLRYGITRRFAPYVGVDWERAFGKTADLQQGAPGGVSDLSLVAGVRAWF